jgi:ribonuclease P protein component
MRFGLAVGKRVGNATVRNTVKRRIRESIRLLDVSGSSDIIVSARPDAATADYSAIQASLASLLTRLGITSKPKRN